MKIRRKKLASVSGAGPAAPELGWSGAPAPTVERETSVNVGEALRSGGLDRFVGALAEVLLADLERHS